METVSSVCNGFSVFFEAGDQFQMFLVLAFPVLSLLFWVVCRRGYL